eukprot:CAMPEP_0174278312 /NCGR_PEP_ID=MMETSP0439-20130205/61407_1 /TAXON_ID=0 /ORGANISM="Stereomyxa ramosa, Strain Chinc5" /LENGTH=546 /DNA_ID=CAMNT_0015370709 /DNA_START=25 /DNA_END=1661 /DNA_ORIENTATION=+
MKYILVTGGVLSGLGKGIVTSSIGLTLRAFGFNVTAIKIDPYLNMDAGTMSPFEHGEVFVLDDGGEADLDLGNYERFMDITLTRDNNITTGKIYSSVIEKERRGEYLGKTVQVVPHITDCIKQWIERVATIPSSDSSVADICVIELGGTIGDIEQGPFVEALRQLQFSLGKENFFLVHLSLIPVVGVVGEQKTKPTQNSVKQLRALGLSPDLIVCRCQTPVARDVTEKIASFCMVPSDRVVSVHDVSNIFRVPLLLQSQGVSSIILETLGLTPSSQDLSRWEALADRVDEISGKDSVAPVVTIAVVGKYTVLSDAYLSLIKALNHASVHLGKKLVVNWIESAFLEPEAEAESNEEYLEAWKKLKEADGILVPGGFGLRGVEGKILAISYARTNKIPFLGICLGMQLATVEYARNVLGLEDVHSMEAKEECEHPVVIFMPEGDTIIMGATMRLGKRTTTFVKEKRSVLRELYGGKEEVDERHRHRYEVNPKYIAALEDAGFQFVAYGDNGRRAEVVEISDHPFFVGVQYHPEFKTRPNCPSPPFIGL